MSDKITVLASSGVAHGYGVVLENIKEETTGRLSWRVTYGQQVTTWNTLEEGAKEYRLCVNHQWYCASLIEDDRDE